MNKLRPAFLATIALTLAVVFGVFLLPAPAAWTGSVESFHIRLGVALFIPAMHVIAALFFFGGLSGFKQEFRTAYRLIAVGVIIIGVALLQSPMVTFFDLWDSWPMVLGIVNVPFILAVAVIFIGIRTFYRKLEVPSIWQSLPVSAAFVAIGILAAIFTPHAPSPIDELSYDTGSFFFALSSLALLVTAFNIFAIRKQIVPSYARVLSWLGGGLVFEALLVGGSVVLKAFGLDTREATGTVQDYLVLAAIPYMVAGYLFYQLTADTRKAETQAGAGIIDVLMYVSSLASSQKAIAPMLDDMRLITARTRPGEPIAEADKVKLADVYLRLERYLTTQEKLRSFTTPQLRAQVYARFNNQVSATVDSMFWQRIPLQRNS